MKIIITGATGFLGRNLAESFHADGLQVTATGRSSAVGDELHKESILFKKADILNLNQLNNAFSPADCVIHCAARSGPWGKYRDFYDTNVVGTRNVIKLCKKHHIKKIIFISTPSIYFTGKDRYNISNGDPISVKEWFFQVLTIFNRPFKPKNVPESAAKIIAGIMEFGSYLPFAKKEPSMARFTIEYMSKSMTMTIDKAKQKLNYSPQVSNQQGFERYATWYYSK